MIIHYNIYGNRKQKDTFINQLSGHTSYHQPHSHNGLIKGESQFSVLPLPLSFAHSRESKGCPNSRFDRGVGLKGRGRYPLKPIIFASLLETKGYPEHTAARSSREYFRLK